MSEWRTLDSENALIRSVDDAPDANVLVRNNDADNRLCYIYCSSKNLYQKDNRGAFAANVIDNDRFEWTNRSARKVPRREIFIMAWN